MKNEFSTVNVDDSRYVSLSRRAEVIQDKAKTEELWNPLYRAWFPKGVNDPDLVLLKVKVEAAEYWDSSSSLMVKIAGFAKSIFSGKPNEGDHQRLNLRH